MKQHRFDMGRPCCGTADGVNAADMEPPEVTCKRCRRMAPLVGSGSYYAYSADYETCRLVQGEPEPGNRLHRVSSGERGSYYHPGLRRRVR